MPKLLSRSKHEEFESNSTLQIKDQKERRAENTKKMESGKFGSCSTVHPALFLPVACSCFLTPQIFVAFFFVSSYFNTCNSFCFGFFCYFPYTEHLYKPQSVQTLNQLTSIHVGNTETGAAVSPLLPPD